MKLKKITCCIVLLLTLLFCFADTDGSDITNPENDVVENGDKRAKLKAKDDNSKKENDKQNGTDKKINENIKTEKLENDSIASLQNSGLTIGYGDRWLFEQLDTDGNIVSSVLYDKDKLLETKTYTYTDSILTDSETVLKDSIIKTKYNPKGFKTEIAVYNLDGKTLIEKTLNIYDDNNLLMETSLEKNNEKRSSKFTYNAKGSLLTKTDFVNENKTLFTEYIDNKKFVHLFENEKEIKVLEE